MHCIAAPNMVAEKWDPAFLNPTLSKSCSTTVEGLALHGDSLGHTLLPAHLPGKSTVISSWMSCESQTSTARLKASITLATTHELSTDDVSISFHNRKE